MGYVTVAEARLEGITGDATTSVTDARLQAAIDEWSAFVDRACRQWFDSRSLTIYLDGTEGDTLWLPVPIITLTALYINGDFTNAADLTGYNVHNSRDIPDDRTNPRITVKRESDSDDFFYRTVWGDTPRFVKGERNQKLVGTFGYTDAKATTPFWQTPYAIKRAVLKLISKSLMPLYPAGPSASPLVPGTVKSEKTDGHSIDYAVTSAAGFMSITGDAEVDAILRLFRAPLAMGVPISIE